MFDIGFWELTLVGLVALVVIGPERLPKVARVLGFWIGKAQRTVSSVKQEIKEELHAEEIRQSIANESSIKELQDLADQVSETSEAMSAAGRQVRVSVESAVSEPDKEKNQDES